MFGNPDIVHTIICLCLDTQTQLMMSTHLFLGILISGQCLDTYFGLSAYLYISTCPDSTQTHCKLSELLFFEDGTYLWRSGHLLLGTQMSRHISGCWDSVWTPILSCPNSPIACVILLLDSWNYLLSTRESYSSTNQHIHKIHLIITNKISTPYWPRQHAELNLRADLWQSCRLRDSVYLE